MNLFIWTFDGFDLCYSENNKSHMTGLCFEKEDDAWYAYRVFNNFIHGEK